MDISIVIPAYNEERNIEPLYFQLKKVLGKLNKTYEIIFVDDGSTDKTFDVLKNLRNKDKQLKVVSFTRNFGQTAAWDAGIKQSKGDHIITLDADLQNDPSDIPPLIKKINEGYDVVSGWRVNRKDPLSKKVFSLLANFLRIILIKEKIHDSGCSLKIYKKECFKNIDLQGEMHRFITGILSLNGFKVGEIKVKHNPRRMEKTKYGSKRLFKGFLDLIMVTFLTKYSSRPIHLFGGLGLLTFFLGFIIGLYLTVMKLFYGTSLSNRPLLILGVLLILLGTQFIIFGILAEILMRIYSKVQDTKPYIIKEILK